MVVVLGLHNASPLQPSTRQALKQSWQMFVRDFRDRFAHNEVSASANDMHLQSLRRYTGGGCGPHGIVEIG